MADWNPGLYRRFEAERTRPARDLLAGVDPASRGEVVDLGCGPGNSTELLRQRFPDARLTGVDSSDAMLASARERLRGSSFVKADIAEWTPDRAPDLIFANAALQWVPDHGRAFPRLFGMLAAGGVLAVQMPDNLEEPTHRTMLAVAQAGNWRAKIGDADGSRQRSVLDLPAYYDLLAREAAQVNVWRTVYHHPMNSVAAVVAWLRSTGLRPFLDPLTPTEQEMYLRDYERALLPYYPARADGLILLRFPRLFIVARRAA